MVEWIAGYIMILHQLLLLFSVEWYRRMITIVNLKEMGRKRPWPTTTCNLGIRNEEDEENHEKLSG